MQPPPPRACALALTLVLAACGSPGAEDDGPAPAPAAAPRRLVTLAPNLTEIAFALGLGDRVVGVGSYATWPPEVRELPRLGGLVDPDLERILALEPDLALLLPSQEEVARRLEAVSIETLVVPVETLDDLEAAILAVARRCRAGAAARDLVASLRRELAPRPVPGAPHTAVVVNRAPGRTEGLLVAGPGTWYDELLGRLGAANAFADAPLRYPQVGVEEVLARAPGALLELRPEPPSDPLRRRLAADWQGFPTLPAAARGSVFVIGGDWALSLGPRVPLLYRRMEEALRAGAAKGA